MSSGTNGKVKTYKNAERNKRTAYKPYVPQYQVHGVEPGEYKGAIVPSDTKVAGGSADNPRGSRAAVRQPYATAQTSPIGTGPVPNVGNNMEHTWSSVDGEIIDDLSGEQIDPNHPMVDNNDFVTPQAFGFRNGITAEDIQPVQRRGTVIIERTPEPSTEVAREDSEDLLSILNDLPEAAYLLIVAGVPLCSGPKEEIQDQARALAFGEHEMCGGNPIPQDDIIIIKRVEVKIGLFLE